MEEERLYSAATAPEKQGPHSNITQYQQFPSRVLRITRNPPRATALSVSVHELGLLSKYSGVRAHKTKTFAPTHHQILIFFCVTDKNQIPNYPRIIFTTIQRVVESQFHKIFTSTDSLLPRYPYKLTIYFFFSYINIT